jgi:hypothetical protein
VTIKRGIAFFCMGLLMISLAPARAPATLGGTLDSIESDRRALFAVRGSSESHSAFTVHQIDRDGTFVREYVSFDNVVFAIAWNGIRSPDLNTLLGSYAARYRKAVAQAPHQPGMRHNTINTDDIIVQRWGQVGDLQGRAYVPALVPAGVSIDEIK